MRLANGIIAIDFDPRTGSLVQIEDMRTGMSYLSDPADGRLFRLFVPDEEEWIDRYGESHQSEPPLMSVAGETLTIVFPDVTMADGKPSGIKATVLVNLPAGADEARFSLQLEHSGPHTICEAIFPWIGGWRGYPGKRGHIRCGSNKPFDPFTQLRRNIGWNLLQSTRKAVLGFPYTHIPVCDITNDEVGLAYNFYPVTRDLSYDFSMIDLNERAGDPHPSFGWVHYPFLKTGGSWTSGTVGLSPHQGDWHFAADKMRAWLDTWWQAPDVPENLRRSIGFHNAYFREFSGREWRSYSDMPELARFGKEHGLGHFIVWDMSMLGDYLRAGSAPLFADKPERIEELRKALQEVRDMGVSVSPLFNSRLTNQVVPFWKEHGEKWAIRSKYGIPTVETHPLRRNAASLVVPYFERSGARLCQQHPEFQSWVIDKVQDLLDLGFNAVFLDQPFSEDHCFGADHGHPVPMAVHGGACDWTERATAMVHAQAKDGYTIGEVPDIWNTQSLDMWWFWEWTAVCPEVFRYTLPDSLQSWVIDPYDHEDQVGQAFAQGFLLNINVHALEGSLLDVPEFASRIAQLAALREKTADFTVLGRFCDLQGMTVETDAAVSAARYDAGDRTGVIIAETSKESSGGGTVKITLSPEATRGVRPVEIIAHRQDGSTQALVPTHSGDNVVIEMQLARWEAAVIEVV